MANVIDQLMSTANDPARTPTIGMESVNPDAPLRTHVEAPHRGGLQNVLGFLGDFLMSRLKMGTPYRDAREAEKINAARLNDMQDPTHAYASLGNLDPKLAALYRNQDIDNERSQAMLDSTAEMRAARAEAVREARRRGIFTNIANSFNAALSDAKTDDERKKAYDAMRTARLNSAELLRDPALVQDFNDRYPEQFDPYRVSASTQEFTGVPAQWSHKLATQKVADQESQFDRKQTETETYHQGQLANGAVRASAAAASAGAAVGRANDYHAINTNPDGTPIRANDPGRHPSSGARPLPPSAASGAPPVGYKNRHGLTFQGGDPNNIANWKK